MIPLLLALAGCGEDCGGQEACETDGRTWYALPPEGWDGSSALPMVLLAHSYRATPNQFMGDEAVVQAFSDGGVLLVLPRAEDGVWAVNQGGGEAEDIAFIETVLDEVDQRWPLDHGRQVVSGFSIGASLAYVLACERAERFSAAYPLSGGFWEPLPTSCAGPPIALGHEHGAADEVWPLEGRAFDADTAQGSAPGSAALLREASGCSETSTQETIDGLTCTVWSDCEDGVVSRFCLHEGRHQRAEGWVERLLAFSLAFTRE